MRWWKLISLCVFAANVYGQNTVKECGAVLAKDYYSYAEKNNLRLDFLRSVDSQSWEELRTKQQANVSLFDIFSFGDDYATFSQKRNRFLETEHYNRNEEQAKSIIQIVTSDRAYPAYEHCLQTVSSGPALRAWASRETMDEIDLRVRYVNPPGVKQIVLDGHVEGGSVDGAPVGRLWNKTKVWGVNQEFLFVVKRAPGTSNTKVVIDAEDGSVPVALNFERADGTLTLKYAGTVDILRQANRENSVRSPNNDHNRGNCPNMVGHHDGKWCTSRTSVSLSTQAPHFFGNVRGICRGGACPWTGSGPAKLENNNTSASFYLDNWGSAVDAVVIADDYERVDASKCGGDGPIPVVLKQSVVFTGVKECLPMATIQWTKFPNKSQGAAKFGQNAADNTVVLTSPTIDNGSVVLATYKLDK
jgi:hypothetical protein